MSLLLLVVGMLLSTTATSVEAQQPSAPARELLIGIGSGTGGDASLEYSGTPWSVNLLFRDLAKRRYFGIDFAGEGTSLNNTSGKYNEVEQGFSFNVQYGGTANLRPAVRLGGGFLIGLRLTGKSCPDSYLGYECYAGEAPTPEYALNYGSAVFAGVGKVTVGARVSGVSKQVLVGFAY